MIRRLALLVVATAAVACTPASSPSDGLETVPGVTSPTPTLESTMPSAEPTTELPSESPSESPSAS